MQEKFTYHRGKIREMDAEQLRDFILCLEVMKPETPEAEAQRIDAMCYAKEQLRQINPPNAYTTVMNEFQRVTGLLSNTKQLFLVWFAAFGTPFIMSMVAPTEPGLVEAVVGIVFVIVIALIGTYHATKRLAQYDFKRKSKSNDRNN